MCGRRSRRGPRHGPGSRGDPLGNQLGADHGDLAWSVDPESDLPPFQSDDSHADVVTDEELLHELPRQHQHGTDPLGPRISVPNT